MRMDIEKDKYRFIEINNDLINRKIIRVGSNIIFKLRNLVLVEYYTGKSYTYKVVDIITKEAKHLYHSKKQLEVEGYDAIKERMLSLPMIKLEKQSIIKADNINAIDREKQLITYIFESILPKYNFFVRRSQIELAINMYDSIRNRNIALCEAEVGTGKTFSYLIAGLVSRLFWDSQDNSKGFNYDNNNSSTKIELPIVITTSSIALQKAIIEDYIPLISTILMKEGVISKKITAVIRKGKKHYICDRRLKDCINSIPRKRDKSEFEAIIKLLDVDMKDIDLDNYDEISSYVKARINVPNGCNSKCPQYTYCRYNKFLNYARSYRNDIQLCNHNYFLADLKRRNQNKIPLIPEYSVVIMDECHKILDAARQMYGTKIAKNDIDRLMTEILRVQFHKKKGRIVKESVEKLRKRTERVFRELLKDIQIEDIGEAGRFSTHITSSLVAIIKTMTYSINSLVYNLENSDQERRSGLTRYIVNSLLKIKEKLNVFIDYNKIIYWIEFEGNDKNRVFICSIPKDINKKLFNSLWSKRLPFILTSGTLSENGSFMHFKKKTGIDLVESFNSQGRAKVQEVTKSSPFKYSENTLLYINHRIPFPDSKDKAYIKAISSEITELIKATFGHTMVLFTSYKTMDLVFKQVAQNIMDFPIIKMSKGISNSIDRFRDSKNGVFFATGAVWEGTDISGDILSSLIIVKLPFSIPDPISEYEQTKYESFHAYRRDIIIPEMIIKLRQGIGRLIRSETDTGVLSILDCRMNPNNQYYDRILKSLPKYRVTNDIGDVKAFIKIKKDKNYFSEINR